MLVVPTELRASPIQGVGVFILAPAKKGDLIWRFDSRIDRVYCKEEVDSLPPLVREFIDTRGYWHKESGLWILCGDNGKYLNHSDTPSMKAHGRGFSDDSAAYDLAAGTELTTNYYEFYDNTETVARMGLSGGKI